VVDGSAILLRTREYSTLESNCSLNTAFRLRSCVFPNMNGIVSIPKVPYIRTVVEDRVGSVVVEECPTKWGGEVEDGLRGKVDCESGINQGSDDDTRDKNNAYLMLCAMSKMRRKHREQKRARGSG
jgi:hypothetical protein